MADCKSVISLLKKQVYWPLVNLQEKEVEHIPMKYGRKVSDNDSSNNTHTSISG
jgi:hypothetical protein